MTTCRDIMTADPLCHESSVSVGLVAKTMKENDIGPVPIVDSQNHLIGIVTDRDLTVRVLATDRDGRATKVKDVMTSNPVACCEDDNIEYALKIMEQCQVRRIPVVDIENRLQGIISQADIATRLKIPSQTAEVVEEVSRTVVEHDEVHGRYKEI